MGMEAIRKEQLVVAAIEEVGASGSMDVTVGKIAKRAGVSSALAFHYFGGKDQLFLGAMRHILQVYSAEVRAHLEHVDGPRSRIDAILSASFAPSNFAPHVVAAWLIFYVSAQKNVQAARLLTVYQRRLRSNLLVGLRPLSGARADSLAAGLGALIDGLYIRQALGTVHPEDALAQARSFVDYALKD